MSKTVDLRDRGKRSILVKKWDATIDDDYEREFSQVIDMDSTIEVYCEEYANDLEARLDLKCDKLPPALAVTTKDYCWHGTDD
jgi:hypothetical protein